MFIIVFFFCLLICVWGVIICGFVEGRVVVVVEWVGGGVGFSSIYGVEWEGLRWDGECVGVKKGEEYKGVGMLW